MNKKKLMRNRLRVLFLCICCLISFIAGIISANNQLNNNGFDANSGFITGIFADKSQLSLYGRKIIVDAGHGGSDSGTIGPLTGIYEEKINLEISYKLKDELEKLGATVIMTRTEEDSKEVGTTKKLKISERGGIIDKANGDMLISIHQNFNDDSSSIRGVQILLSDSDSLNLATDMQNRFNHELNTNLNYLMKNYQVLMYGNQPSIIVECGFFSNEEDEKLLQTKKYQKRLVNIMVDIIKNQFDESNITKEE